MDSIIIDTNQSRRLLIYFLCLFAVLQSGLRDISLLPEENDTQTYEKVYSECSKKSWGEVLMAPVSFNSDYEERDAGYPILIKITQLFVDDFTFFMFLTSSVFIAAIGFLIDKYVKTHLGVILSFLIYYALFTNIVNSFMRQAIALSIVIFALKYIVSRDWKRYFALLLVTFTIHSSVIVAIPFYFLPRFSTNRKWLLVSIIISPFLVLCVRFIMILFLTGSVYEQYSEANVESPINYILLIYVVSVLVFLYYYRIIEIEDSEILVSAAIGSMLLLPIAFFGNTLLRVSYYYVVFLIVLIPVLIESLNINENIRILIFSFSISFFLFLTLR